MKREKENMSENMTSNFAKIIDETRENIKNLDIKRENLEWDEVTISNYQEPDFIIFESNISALVNYNNKKGGIKGFLKRQIHKLIYPIFRQYFDLQIEFDNEKNAILKELLVKTSIGNKK